MSAEQKYIVCEITLQVQNEQALRAEACDIARFRGLPLEQAREYLDPDKQTIEQCANLLLAPPHTPAGTDVLGVICEAADELHG